MAATCFINNRSCDLVSLRFVSDGTVAIFMSMLFFVIPSRLPSCGDYGYNEAGEMLIFNTTNHIYREREKKSAHKALLH